MQTLLQFTTIYLIQTAKKQPFEFEASVGETDQPTSRTKQEYISTVLKRLSMMGVSIAPRYLGLFGKGVNYIWDVTTLKLMLNLKNIFVI